MSSERRVVLICADLMFGSKVEAMVREVGMDCLMSADIPASGAGDALWIADLAQGDFAPEDLAERGAPVLAFYSHVEDEMRRRAIEVGIDKIVPRSRMMREGPSLIKSLARN